MFSLPTCAAQLEESFDLAIPAPPKLAPVAGVHELAYELHLTNFTATPLALRGLRILDAAGGRKLLALDGAGLAERLAIVPPDRRREPTTLIEPGRRAVLYLELRLAPGQVPSTLTHEIDYTRPGTEAALLVRGATVAVDRGQRAALGPPLAGGPWVAVHHPIWQRGHRRVTYTIDGRTRIPGRYAVDFIKVSPAGRTANGDPDLPANAIGYGVSVLAVADALVATVRGDMAESASVSGNPRNAIGDASGNYVALQLADGRFVFYEHLKPGSITVKAGDRVHRGQVIAALGFTGDTTGPHLHFHVADANSPLGAEGQPFALERFKLLGHYPDIAAMGKRMWQAKDDSEAATRHGEWPDSNAVIEFDD